MDDDRITRVRVIKEDGSIEDVELVQGWTRRARRGASRESGMDALLILGFSIIIIFACAGSLGWFVNWLAN